MGWVMRTRSHVLVAVVSCLSSIAAQAIVPRSAIAAETLRAPDVLRAQLIEIVDGAGRVRARLGMKADSPALELLSTSQHVRSSLFLGPGGPMLVLSDSADQPRVMLDVMDNKGSEAGLLVMDASGEARATLMVRPNGQPVRVP